MRAGYSDAARPLTPRMRDVLASGAAGRTVKQTALELGLAETTVWSVRAALCARTGHNFTATVYLYGRGELH